MSRQPAKLFPGQEPDEKIIILLRRHWSIILKFILRLIAFMAMPVVVIGLLAALGWELELGGFLYILAVMAVSLYYIFIWLFYFHEFVDYYLDLWIVTDKRIINIEQEGLFNRRISELSIDKVQDVTSEIKGKRQTFLDYGFVHIQTAGESERFIFEEVPHPREVARLIMDGHDRAQRRLAYFQPKNNNASALPPIKA